MYRFHVYQRLLILCSAVIIGLGCGHGSRPGPADTGIQTTPDGSTARRRATASGGRTKTATRPQFANVAAESGVDFIFFNDQVPDRYFLPEVMGGGVAWLDFDGDGRLDLYLANGCPLKTQVPQPVRPSDERVNHLYRNLGSGRFREIGRAADVADTRYGQGCAVGDYDADGFPDLYVANFGRNVLFHNNGDGTFSEATDSAGVAENRWSTSCVWLDIDADADLDLYVVNYLDVNWSNHEICEHIGKPVYCGPGQYEGVPDSVYVNQGDGTFVERGVELGIDTVGGKGLAIAALDLDQDLRPEIYVANDMAANFLFTRSGQAVSYRNVAVESGCAVSGEGQNEASMGVACADFDNDGLADIFLTHFFSQKNTLYRNLGGLLFEDDSRRTRVAAASFQTLGFGTVPLDYDLDGAIDLFVANGHVLGPLHDPNAMRPQLLANDGRGRFADVSSDAGPYFRELWLGRGAAGADYDDDGDTDLAVTHLNRPFALLRNDTLRNDTLRNDTLRNDTRSTGHFIGLKLVSANRIPPIGGRVVVTRGSQRWSRAVAAGGSYLSTGDERLLFGLGDSDGKVDIEVHWPSGNVQRFEQIEVDRYWRLPEGRDAKPF